jgi:hypothetical protein
VAILLTIVRFTIIYTIFLLEELVIRILIYRKELKLLYTIRGILSSKNVFLAITEA